MKRLVQTWGAKMPDTTTQQDDVQGNVQDDVEQQAVESAADAGGADAAGNPCPSCDEQLVEWGADEWVCLRDKTRIDANGDAHPFDLRQLVENVAGLRKNDAEVQQLIQRARDFLSGDGGAAGAPPSPFGNLGGMLKAFAPPGLVAMFEQRDGGAS